ncbi:MAG: glycoside hydrolase family 16 protein [Prevotellaceae bacterium]|jgi:beta-glucanase (GH16 family)|nr:glycoside hydrolase family 16 protein [Prevotellaceae bacterium]
MNLLSNNPISKYFFVVKRFTTLLFVFLAPCLVSCGCSDNNGYKEDIPDPVPTENPVAEWKLVFQDDFNGTSVNTADWSMYNSPGHAGNGLRRPGAFSVADGVLSVTAQMIDGQLVSGGMAHKLNLAYGKFEARVRAGECESKATSAVLLTWPQSERWPVDGENDFYETGTNDRRSFDTFIHYGANNNQFHKKHNFDVRDWLIVAMEWEPEWIKIYVNGVLQWTLTEKIAIPQVPHHLCIQLDAFKKEMTGITIMQVDWVKIYERVEQKKQETTLINNSF